MNRPEFYKALRKANSGVFGKSLSQGQVDGIEALLDAGEGLPVPHMANVLAQVHRETGGGMYPVKETVYASSSNRNPSDATVIARLDRAFAKGQLSWVRTPYWRGGAFGRGQIQITHDYNYEKFGIDDYSDALDLPTSARIAVRGMAGGMFTGRKLSDYNGAAYDHAGARAIVNGDGGKRDRGATKTIAQIIAENGRAFEAALRAGGWSEKVKPKDKPRSRLGAIFAALFGGRK